MNNGNICASRSALYTPSINHCTALYLFAGWKPILINRIVVGIVKRRAKHKVKISVCNCRQSRSVSGRHGWLTEVNGGTGGSPDNLNSLIILTIGIVVAIITYICVLHIQFTESKILQVLQYDRLELN